MDWLLRIVDVCGALAARGYPQGAEVEVHLEVRDTLLPANDGRFVLTIANGQGEVREGGRGGLRVDVRGLATLYSGHLSPEELRATGLLDGEPRDLAAAALAFAGPAPWMPDMF
jgi:predicted acetyltransferase